MSYYEYGHFQQVCNRPLEETGGSEAMTSMDTPEPQRRQRLAQAVVNQLRSQIESGVLAAGDQLPTEPQLEAQFGVSRTVVREAIADLRASGYVRSIQGKGVFVHDL